MQLLITGASGFIGSFLVEEALRQGYEVWAGVRKSSSKAYLQDSRIHFIVLDFGNPEVLRAELSAHCEKYGKWDFIVHAAGATKARDEKAFFATNYEGTRHLVEALEACSMKPKRFVYMSSLSVAGAIREHAAPGADGHRYAPITASDVSRPNTAYGRSKLASERFLLSLQDWPVVILRPTGVYGPRERDYYLMAKSLASHVDFSVGYRRQEITFVYVRDLVDAVLLALSKGEVGQTYLVSDGHTYLSSDFSRLLQQQMGVHCVLHIKAPLWVLRVVCALSGLMAKWTGRMTALNNDKYNILKQRNWRCDIRPIEALGYKARYDLRRGVEETVAWYKKEKWI